MNNGNHRVYVDWIDNTGSTAAGGYKIGFRISGKYSLSGASLVSGIHHDTVNGNSLRSVMSADMTAKYKGEVYNSSVSGTSGVNYKDGDAFSFYIFPDDAYEKDKVSLSEIGIVELTVKDIYKNIWSKK